MKRCAACARSGALGRRVLCVRKPRVPSGPRAYRSVDIEEQDSVRPLLPLLCRQARQNDGEFLPWKPRLWLPPG
eukprot:6424073-Prymnesium_polylepis.1